MLSEINIKNFRMFANLRVDGLSQFNVITGRNGTGKTSFLEAVFLNAGPGNASLVLSIANFRGDTTISPDSDRLFRSLFHKMSYSQAIEIRASEKQSASSSRAARQLAITPITASAGQAGSSAATEKVRGVTLAYKRGPVRSEASIKWEQIDGSLQATSTPGAGPRTGLRFAIKNEENADLIDARYVMSQHHNIIQQIHSQLTQIVKDRSTSKIVTILQMLDNRVRDVLPLNEDGENVVLFDVGLPQLVPLFSMGNGMFNLTNLAANMATISKGILLIDEIENGLHYSTYGDVVRFIISQIRDKDIQVFAATHSDDFISTFAEVCSDAGFENAAALRFGPPADGSRVTRFNYSDIVNSRDMSLELR